MIIVNFHLTIMIFFSQMQDVNSQLWVIKSDLHDMNMQLQVIDIILRYTHAIVK